jgi:hypothetical protein
MNTSECEIIIAKRISRDLVLRDSAVNLMEEIERCSFEKVVIDFQDVESITRSFAHEYVSRKRRSRKTILEKNVPLGVEKMFMVVSTPPVRKGLEDLRGLKVKDIREISGPNE